jgi:hypothetical protein
MIKNISSLGTKSVLKKALGLSDKEWNAINNETSPRYYLRAEKIAAGKHKFKRQLAVRFSLVPFLLHICEEFNVFLTSWFDSFKSVGGLVGDIDSQGIMSDQVDRFIAYINQNCRSQLVCRTVRAVNWQHNHLGGRSVYSSFFQILPSSLNSDGISREFNSLQGNYVALKFTSQVYVDPCVSYDGGSYVDRTDNERINESKVLFFKVHDQLFSRFGATLSSSQTFVDRNSFVQQSDPIVALQDLHYLRGHIHPSSNSHANEQMLLPLVCEVEPNRSVYQEHIESLSVTPCSIWALGDADELSVRFLGEVDPAKVPSDWIKKSLKDYELTRDASKLGKGVIYIDDENICYCPLTGVALECVVDYKPVVYDYAETIRYVD